MAPEDHDIEDLYDDEFDFVDGEESDLDDDDSDLDSAGDDADVDSDAGSKIEEVKPAPREVVPQRPAARQQRFDSEEDPRDRQPRDVDSRDFDRGPDPAQDDEPAEEIKRPEAPANYRVHVYEYGEFKRTIDRPFTAEDAEAFASEYNRTSKSYSRFAVTGKEDVKPKKLLDDAKLPG